MSDNSIGQTYTGYWEAYDLQEDPFSEVDHNYTSSHWHEYLELLQHLSLYSNVMLAVAGEEDTGRSIFLNQFRTKINIHIDTHFIKADAYFDHNALLDTIVDAYNFAGIGSNSSDFSDRATSLLTNIERSEKSVLIIIENAHLLSASTLEAMLFFIKEQPADNALLHIVLFGDLELQSKLANLEQQTDSENFVHSLELELCSPEETERYLRHKVNQAGTEAVFPFSNQDVLQVHKLSEGYFKRIDRFARDILLERSTKESSSLTGPSGKTKWITTSLVSVAIVATGFGWYHLHRLGNPSVTQTGSSTSTSFIPKQISSIPSQIANQFKRLTHWNSSKETTDSSEKKVESQQSSKLASLLEQTDSSIVATPAVESKPADTVVETVEKLREKRVRNEAVIARNEALVKKRLEELLRENESPSASHAKSEEKHAEAKASHVKIAKVKIKHNVADKVAEAKSSKSSHPAAHLTTAAKKVTKAKAAKQQARAAVIQQEKAMQNKLLVSREDAFSAEDMDEYDKELERLKHAQAMENPEEAAVIDKVISVPDVSKPSVAVRKSATTTLGDALTQHAEAQVDAKATAKLPVNARPVPAHQLSKVERKKLIETGSFRAKQHARRNDSKTDLKQAAEVKLDKPALLEQQHLVKATPAPEVKHAGSTAVRTVTNVASYTGGSDYTLQLVGGHTRSNVEGFVKRHSLSKAVILKSTRSGKDWYIVMYGHYDSVDQAKGAIQTLPSAVQKLHPWIRETKNIKS